jgi:Cytochrome c554 and c-prime
VRLPLSLSALCALALGACSAREPVAAPPQNLVLVTGLRGELEPCGCSGELVGGLDRIVAAIEGTRRTAQGTLVILAGDIVGPEAPSATDTAADARAQQDAAKAALLDRTLCDLKPALLIDDSRGRSGPRLTALARASGATLVVASGIGATKTQRLSGPQVVVLGAGPNAASECLSARRDGVDLVVALSDGDDDQASDAPCRPDLWLHPKRSDAPWRAGGDLHIGLDSPEQRVIAARLVPSAQVALRRWDLEPVEGTSSWQVPLSAAAPRDPRVRARMDQLFASFAPPASARVATEADGLRFVGSRTCAACHTGAYVWWRSTPHGRALGTLEKRGRAHDLACVGCHVTGFGEPGGSTAPPFGELASVGCESCHGQGSAHVDDPSRPTAAGPLREPVCARCHDAAHSAGFAFGAARLTLDAPPHHTVR